VAWSDRSRGPENRAQAGRHGSFDPG